MKKLIYLIVLTLILGLVLTGCLLSNVGQVPVTEQSGITYLTKHTADAPQVTTLFAGQTIDVGTVSVWNDCVNLYVKYETTGGWVMTETHLAVVTSVADFPTNKPGNLMVGHFPYGEENIFQNTWEEIIELSAIPAEAGQELFIAAHAVVADTSITLEEVVVSRPGIDVYGPLGDYAGLGDIIWGSANPAVATWVHSGWTANINIPDATWISTAEYVEDPVNNSWRWFHDEITLPEKGYYIAGSVVLATADNAEEVYFNEEPVGSNGNWTVPTEYSIEPQPGLNTLDFIVKNYAGGSATSNPTGLIYKTTVTYYPEESAWAAGFDFPGANWATYFNYTVQEVLIDTVTVYPNGTPYDSHVTLEAGKHYRLEASGTFTYNSALDWADAEWYLKSGVIVKGDTEGSKPYVLDISIDGYSINRDWGDYNPLHVYTMLFDGTGSTIAFSIYDSAYSDNKGSLTVDIYCMP